METLEEQLRRLEDELHEKNILIEEMSQDAVSFQSEIEILRDKISDSEYFREIEQDNFKKLQEAYDTLEQKHIELEEDFRSKCFISEDALDKIKKMLDRDN